MLRSDLLQEWFTLSDQLMAEMLIDTPCSRPIFLVSLSPIEVFLRLNLQFNTYPTQVTIAEPPPLATASRGDLGRGGQMAASVGEGERQVQKASGGARD
ncbi:MAG: hypothetical protein ACK5RA_02425 [Cyanobacteriota bacterium]